MGLYALTGILLFVACQCYLGLGAWLPKKSTCVLLNGRADCSHLRLDGVPQDLPPTITWLDVSHNQLVALPPASMARYPWLVHLDVGYNSITRLEVGLCLALPCLQTLSMQRNEVHLLARAELANCSDLAELDLSGNRLKLRDEPFSALKSLRRLDVSRSSLTTARLGIKPQLWNLEWLNLSGNGITSLRSDDFAFLLNSSLQVLQLANLTLKMVERDCFDPIAGMRDLLMDGNKIPPLVANLSAALSGTKVRRLSLRRAMLASLNNITFRGLEMTNLIALDLSRNGLVDMGSGSFQWLRFLEVLSLEENNLKRLTKGSFYGLSNLRKLVLSRALVKSHTASYPVIEDNSFQPLSRLTSLVMDHTAFRDITERTFAGLTSLLDLNLSWSSTTALKTLTNRTFASLTGSPLSKLNLTAVDVTSVAPGAFSCLGNLSTLLLGHNFIHQTLVGTEFQGLTRLEELYLSFNQQKITLTSTSFDHVPALRTLKLSQALVGNLNLDPTLFQNLTNLTLLDLSNNNIANLSPGILDGLANLRVLKLQHNNLARLWKSANPGGPVLFLKDLRGLVSLDMENNGLDEIPVGGLRGLNSLQELSLKRNVLNRLAGSIFDDLPELRVLRMQKNLITSVPREVFGPVLGGLSELHMRNNPFDCTCDSILWFVDWLNRTKASVPDLQDGYLCNTPTAYYNRSVVDFNPESCKDMIPFRALYAISSTAVLTLLAAAFLVRFQGWRIQFYWNILVNRALSGGLKGEVEGGRFEYDAYVIHTEADVGWVERSLIPLEEEHGIKFFVEDRDMVPGYSRLESVVENMRRSRKIVFVVTERLLQDPWCRQFTAHHALHQVIEESRDSVVLVFLQDVQDYRLSRSLLLRRGMLKPGCVLDWPVHRERIPAFHQRLRMALISSNRVG